MFLSPRIVVTLAMVTTSIVAASQKFWIGNEVTTDAKVCVLRKLEKLVHDFPRDYEFAIWVTRYYSDIICMACGEGVGPRRID